MTMALDYNLFAFFIHEPACHVPQVQLSKLSTAEQWNRVEGDMQNKSICIFGFVQASPRLTHSTVVGY